MNKSSIGEGMFQGKPINRRQFMKTAGQAAALSTAGFAARKASSADTPPNVVFIMCDQMRADAMSCLGSVNARTPNLDKMAGDGVLCENFYVNNPVCAPSRMSFFTGLYPHQHGRLANFGGEPLQTLSSTMLSHFMERGYRTGWIGKNHTYNIDLLNQLDTLSERGREKFRAYSKFVPPIWHSDTLWPEEECHPRMTTDEGIEFIGQAKAGEPFFLHLSYFDPHPPYMAPSEYTSRYSSDDMTIPEFVPPAKLSTRFDEHYRALHYDRISDTDLTETMRYYYASIEWGVDYQVGRVLKSLEDKGLSDNTIVVFTSDHGDFMGHHRMVRKAMYNYDALLHVPMIVYAPGRLPAGRKVGNLAQSVDIFPTLAEMSGGKAPEGLPGRSLAEALKGNVSDPEDFSVFASAGYSDLPEDYFDNPEPSFRDDSDVPFHTRVEKLTWQPEHGTAMARTKDWKMILNETREPELYRMAGGHIERENVADKGRHAGIRSKLEKKIVSTWKW